MSGLNHVYVYNYNGVAERTGAWDKSKTAVILERDGKPAVTRRATWASMWRLLDVANAVTGGRKRGWRCALGTNGFVLYRAVMKEEERRR